MKAILFSAWILVLAIAGTGSGEKLFALEGPWSDHPHSRARIISSHDSISPGLDIYFGLEIEIDDEWHTYWKNPGDSGAAPLLNWNVNGVAIKANILWPVPERIEVPPLTTFGYHGNVILPIVYTLPQEFKESELELELEAEWLVCKIECIPAFGSFSLSMPISNDVAPAQEIIVNRIESSLPRIWDGSIAWEKSSNALNLTFENAAGIEFLPMDFFPANTLGLSIKKPRFAFVEKNKIQFTIARKSSFTADSLSGLLIGQNLESKKLVAYSITASGRAGQATNKLIIDQSNNNKSIAMYFFFALLGGFILNLMPCVFPILSIKLLGLIKQAQSTKRNFRIDSLLYSSGVVVSFVTLGLLLAILREAGVSLGWGFQLQSPVFLSLLCLVFLMMAANYLGLFELHFAWASKGEGLTRRKDRVGTFFTGVLAVLAASPCTAPFMGASIGVALSMSWPVIILIFFGLGIGMSVPFLLLIIYPQLISKMPKAGNWMVIFKQFMAFPLIATALWFLWLIGQIAGSEAMLTPLLICFSLGILFWLYKTISHNHVEDKPRPVLKAFFLVLGLISVLVGHQIMFAQYEIVQKADSIYAKGGHDLKKKSGIQWIRFDPEKVESMRQEGKAVFIDFTADWCITCKVNEKMTFTDKKVQDFIADKGIAMVKADWTRRDSRIADILAQHGRAGVPLYLYWRQNAEQPIVLPEVLTPEIFFKHVQ